MRFRLLPALVFLLLAGGCGGPKLYPVTGIVEFADGAPAKELARASVEFDPIEGKRRAQGEIGPDGQFRMGTERPGDGVEPGVYRVCIVPVRDLDRPTPPVMDARFQKLDASGLKVTVEPKSNHVKLTVDRAAPTR